MQNDFPELWSLFDFIQPGSFGTLSEFNRQYVSIHVLALLCQIQQTYQDGPSKDSNRSRAYRGKTCSCQVH